MSDPEFSFTPNANPVIELGLGDTRVPTGTGVWDSARWDNAGAVWQGVEPAWWDVSCYAIEAEVARGRERATERFVPGTAGVVLNNADGWADMAGTPGQIAAVSLRPGRAVRIGVDVHSIGVVWLFRGVIDKVTPTYDPVHPDYVKLDCIDLLGEVGHVKLVESAPVGGDDTTVARINRILDVCKHPVEKRVLTPDVIYAVKHVQTSYGAQAVDLLGQAADSAGGIVYGDEAGNVCYKPYGWQSYDAGEEPNGGAIGNVVAATPGTPAITPEPYLATAGAPVTAPDAPTLTLPGAFTIVATVTHAVGTTGNSYLCGQWADGQREWKIERARNTGKWFLTTSINGTTGISGAFTSVNTPPTGLDETWAFSVLLNNGFAGTTLRAYRRNGGDDLNPLYFPADAAQTVPMLPWANRTSPVSIGVANVPADAWPGRIYEVELESGSSPTPKGTTLWRFDVSDTVAGSTGWTDPRGRTWTVAGAPSGHVHPATIPAVPGTPGDLCPAGWEVAYDRMDLATAVELNRVLPTPVPRMRYTLDTAVTGPVLAGHARFNNTDQQAAISMVLNTITADGTNVEPFLRNLVPGAEVRASDVGDVTNNTRTYNVTGAATGPWSDGAGGGYYDVTIAWVEGLTAIGGVIDVAARFVPPSPYVLLDIAGQALYGTEVYPLTDLTSINGVLFENLANRVIATRGYTAMPRLEGVLLDAKAARGDMATLEAMALCRPEVPTRYRCRLNNDGRIIFDRNMFAVGTQHHIEHNEWTLRIALDDAAWAEEPGDLFAFGVIATPTGPTTFAFETTETSGHTTTWDYGDGTIEQATATETVEHTYDEAGRYTTACTCHRITVYTDVVATDAPRPTAVGIIEATEAGDVATVAGTVGPKAGPVLTCTAAGQLATCEATGFPPNTWLKLTWGDGQTDDKQTNAAGEDATAWQHWYQASGTFPITAKLANGTLIASASVTISIVEGVS